LADYARGHLLTGFPWILLGYAWSGVLPVLQMTSIAGIYGLTLVTAVAACLPASLEEKSNSARFAFAASFILFAFAGGWGEFRLQTTTLEVVPDVRVRLVQPNVDQEKKWQQSTRERDFNKLIDLSAAKGEKPVTHIFWPETASTYYLGEDSLRRNEIAANLLTPAHVMTGVIRRAVDKDGVTHFYNSLVAVDGEGRLVAGYDKAHLVPFGEYMPLRKYIPLRTLAASGADFTPGLGPQTLRVSGLPPFSPLICYEAIFPGNVADPNDRPDFMVNITNDGWYGHTSGPYQHFAIARIRAIEEGMPLLRIANTGISGVIDPLGRIEKRLGVGRQGFIDSDLPKALPSTTFVKFRNVVVDFLFSFFRADASIG
jgi:apolipoprotein N-acyltransferase